MQFLPVTILDMKSCESPALTATRESPALTATNGGHQPPQDGARGHVNTPRTGHVNTPHTAVCELSKTQVSKACTRQKSTVYFPLRPTTSISDLDLHGQRTFDIQYLSQHITSSELNWNTELRCIPHAPPYSSVDLSDSWHKSSAGLVYRPERYILPATSSATSYFVLSQAALVSMAAPVVPDDKAIVTEDGAVREQDKFLPIANISRIMKEGLPQNAKISKDAKELVQQCVSDFIIFVTSEYVSI